MEEDYGISAYLDEASCKCGALDTLATVVKTVEIESELA